LSTPKVFWRGKRKFEMNTPGPAVPDRTTSPAPEFHLPDEDRRLQVLSGEINRCRCGRMMVLHRKGGQYIVRCSITDEQFMSHPAALKQICTGDTGPQPSSSKALQVWKAIQVLSR
jgi:hypothetical protein